MHEFCVQRTSAYISQTDNHIAELTVRETFDFAARCQGASKCFSGKVWYDIGSRVNTRYALIASFSFFFLVVIVEDQT